MFLEEEFQLIRREERKAMEVTIEIPQKTSLQEDSLMDTKVSGWKFIETEYITVISKYLLQKHIFIMNGKVITLY